MQMKRKREESDENLPVKRQAIDGQPSEKPDLLKKPSRITLFRRGDADELEKRDIPDGKIHIPITTTSQTEIEFNQGIKTVFIVKKWKDQPATDALKFLAGLLRTDYQCNILVEAHVLADGEDVGECQAYTPEDHADSVDVVIILGGDGTLLHANSLFQETSSVPPVLGFALGSLGFLVPYQFTDVQERIKTLMQSKRLECVLRSRISCTIKNADGIPVFIYHTLNEILIDRGTSPYLTLLDFFVDERLATYIQADGVIISSATGSTAYSLSAGGPMLSPSVPAIVITPVCPHTLSFRPLVLPDCSKLRINVPETARAAAFVSFDGRNHMEIPRGGQVVITTSKWPMPTICLVPPMMEWFMSIKHRLNWNVRELQKGLEDPSKSKEKKEEGEERRDGEKVEERLFNEDEEGRPKKKKQEPKEDVTPEIESEPQIKK